MFLFKFINQILLMMWRLNPYSRTKRKVWKTYQDIETDEAIMKYQMKHGYTPVNQRDDTMDREQLLLLRQILEKLKTK